MENGKVLWLKGENYVNNLDKWTEEGDEEKERKEEEEKTLQN